MMNKRRRYKAKRRRRILKLALYKFDKYVKKLKSHADKYDMSRPIWDKTIADLSHLKSDMKKLLDA